MAARLAALLGLALALSLSGPARADEPPDPPQVAQKTSPVAHKAKRPFANRPLVVGLLAALFLVVAAGAAGATDKKSPS